ncbi:MAG: cytochrome c, partial [Gammaproteobacteria bacterium]|nr:cytochrome c [Gammaproteobacteria bacterium]
MRIDVYLDDDKTPYTSLTPPEKFKLDTSTLADGPHQLIFRAMGDDGVTSERRMQFNVQNGPAIAVHGILENDTVSGEIDVLANAYGSRIGDEFEPVRIETPAPIPTWTWVLALVVLAWSVGYISSELTNGDYPSTILSKSDSDAAAPAAEGEAAAETDQDWAVLGEQVYGNNCSSCHQVTGTGLPGVFPPLKGNAVVLAHDASEHIDVILNGLSGKVIDGVAYPAPMPPFGAILSDEEVAAVV